MPERDTDAQVQDRRGGVPAVLLRGAALALLGAALIALHRLHGHADYGRVPAWVFLTGLLFGWFMQRSRFCFFCMLRDGFENRDSRAALGMLLALAVGITGHIVLFTAWLPDALAGHLPPRAHIGPASWVIALGGAVFGIGMSLSGSCISSHLYRLGEGSRLSPVALAGAIAGSMLGQATWNILYLRVLSEARPIWLPGWRGFGVGWALPMLALGVLAWGLLRWIPAAIPSPGAPWTLRRVAAAVFVHRWPAWVGGVLIGLLSTAALFRASPLGVTAELNRLARLLGDSLNLLPARLEGLEGFRGCRIAGAPALLTPNALFIIALVTGGLIGSAGTGTIAPSRPPRKAYPIALLGGVLLGWGGFIALGCSIGTLLSGIHAGAVSGWLFAVAMVAGVRLALPIRWWAESAGP